MGGRGGSFGSSGSGSKSEGFTFTNNRGKTTQVIRTSTGAVLVNGQKSNIDYSKMKSGATKLSGFKELSTKDVEKIHNDRANRNIVNGKRIDYELGVGVPGGNKDNRVAARRSRLTGRIMGRSAKK